MKYTASEILKAAGVDSPETVVGKMSVSIGGVTVNRLDQVINMQDADTALVRYGTESVEATLPNRDTISDELIAALEAKGSESTSKYVQSQIAKAESGQLTGNRGAKALLVDRVGTDLAETARLPE